jgi:hypothetical protein
MSKPIIGHKGRDQWMRALLAAPGLAPATLKVGIDLGIYFNCTNGQCNPGYKALVKDTGVDKRTVYRAVAALEEGGWLTSKAGDGSHDQKVSFTLLAPFERVTSVVTRRGDKAMSPVKVRERVTETVRTGDKNRGVRVTTAVTTKEPENLKNLNKSAPPARSSARVDRVDVTETEEGVDEYGNDPIPF